MIKKNRCIVLENYFSELIHSSESYSAGSFTQLKYFNWAFKKNNTTMTELKMCTAMPKVDSM